MSLRPCSDLSPATWLSDSSHPADKLILLGPPGFPAYARLRFIPDPAFEGQHESDHDVGPDAPSETEQLRIVLDTLAAFTTTPHDCYFCLWDGWGSAIHGGDGARILDFTTRTTRPGPPMAPAFPRSVLDGPKVRLPHRAYYLFRGPLSEFGDWGAAEEWPGRPRTAMPNPSFVWPADRAWCVADDVDPHWAGIGAERAAIDRLVAETTVDVVLADPEEEQPHYY